MKQHFDVSRPWYSNVERCTYRIPLTTSSKRDILMSGVRSISWFSNSSLRDPLLASSVSTQRSGPSETTPTNLRRFSCELSDSFVRADKIVASSMPAHKPGSGCRLTITFLHLYMSDCLWPVLFFRLCTGFCLKAFPQTPMTFWASFELDPVISSISWILKCSISDHLIQHLNAEFFLNL